MRVTPRFRSLLALLLVTAVAPAAAHHSFAMFNTESPITLSGVVTDFQWTNPHAYIELDVADAAGVKHWSIELGSTSILQRAGWRFNILKKGDKVAAVVAPLRNGEPGSLLVRITLPDSRVLGNGGATGIGGGTRAPEPPGR